jgi:hypothetical protein
MSHEHISQDCHVCAEALAQKLDKALAEAERLKALMTRCEGCASETAIGGGPPQYCYACWNMKERDVEHAELQYRELVDTIKHDHLWESTGARVSGHEDCATCAILERGTENRYREPKGKDILGSLQDFPDPAEKRLCTHPTYHCYNHDREDHGGHNRCCFCQSDRKA